jgi:hypothetical protein
MNNWDLIKISTTESPYINILVNGIQTLVIKNNGNPQFSLVVHEDEISNILYERERKVLPNNSRIPGGIEIGRFTLPEDNDYPGDWFFLKGKDGLRKHVEKSIIVFSDLVEQYKKWSSFSEYLMSEVISDTDGSTEKQAPFEYWWLTGEKGSSSAIHEVKLYDTKGVFIKPDDKKLPVFTSSLYADMASQFYQQKFGVLLKPTHIYCPTCFFTGLCAFLGKGKIAGGLLNEQWEVRFLTCSKLAYNAPCHFVISNQDGNAFELVGCMDTGKEPLWLPGVCPRDDNCKEVDCVPVLWEAVSQN